MTTAMNLNKVAMRRELSGCENNFLEFIRFFSDVTLAQKQRRSP